MKNIILNIIIGIFIGVLSFSCLPISLNPAHNSEQVITDSTLIGKWEVCSNDSNPGMFELEWYDSVTYLIKTKNDTHRDSVGVSYLGQLTNIEGNLIMSYTTSKETIDTANHISNMFIPGYYFLLINKINMDSLHFIQNVIYNFACWLI